MPSVRYVVAMERPRFFNRTGLRKGTAAGANTAPLAARCGRRLGADGRVAGSRVAACACDVSDIECAPCAREEVAVALPAAHMGQQDGRVGCACASLDSFPLAQPGALKATSKASRCLS